MVAAQTGTGFAVECVTLVADHGAPTIQVNVVTTTALDADVAVWLVLQAIGVICSGCGDGGG